MLNGMQASQLIFILLFAYSHTIKPPGYVEPQKAVDPNPPKYEYGYDIVGDKGGHQGKQEQRDGIYASGRYFVENKNAKTDVQYFADDWGYHPAVEYSSAGPHSKSSAKFALGHEAVVQLRNKENNLPQLQGLPDTGPLQKDGAGSIQSQTIRPIIQPSPQPQPPQQLLLPFPSQPTAIEQNIIKQEPQLPYDPFKQQYLIQEQPQQPQVFQHEPQQQVLIQEQQHQQQVIQHEPQRQVLVQEQPQIQQYIQHEPQQQVLIQEQPQLPVVQHEPQQQQQIVIQHIQQPVEKVIFPQPTPTPIVYQNQEPQQLLVEQQQQQPNIILLDQQKFENSAHIHQNQVAEKLVQTEDQTKAVSYQQFGLKIKGRRPNKLIESTQHLVTGQDVLDINSAVTHYEETSIPSSTPYPTVTEFTVTEPSLQAQPIVVADVEDNKIVSTTESYNLKEEQVVSTTASTVESVSTTFESTSPASTIVVTPRPVSTTFLAPITAGVRLEGTEQYEDKYKLNKQNVQVEIQKTVPYYLGKYEYPISQDQYISNHTLFDQKIRQDIELGKTLLYFPGQVTPQKQLTEVDNHITLQQLPNSVVQNNFLELDQQLAQGYQHQIYLQQYPVKETKEVTRLIPQPYPVKVPYEVRVPYVKQVAVPVTVEKIVEKPVHITKVVEKPVAVPQPYPVEKIIEKPVHIPVQVTKYIDRPYPVHVQVPVPQPYPVEKIVQKIVKQPYPVEVRVPVHIDRIVEKKVPQYIDRPITVEKIVEKPVTQYIDRPYPVHVKVPYPQPVAVPVDRVIEKKVPVPHYIEKQVPVEKIVEKQVPQYIDRPYPVKVEVPVPQPYYIKVEVPRPYPVQLPAKFIEKPYYTLPIIRYHNINYGGVPLAPIKTVQSQIQANVDSQVQSSYNSHVQSNLHSQVQSSYANNIKDVGQSQSEGYYYPNPYSYAPQNNFYLPPKKEVVPNNGYLPPDVKNCDDAIAQQTKQDNYIGLLPPKIGNTLSKFLRKYRSARSSFDDKSVKMEYGFMPPLVPSLEIDEFGNPVNKGDNK